MGLFTALDEFDFLHGSPVAAVADEAPFGHQFLLRRLERLRGDRVAGLIGPQRRERHSGQDQSLDHNPQHGKGRKRAVASMVSGQGKHDSHLGSDMPAA